jgi:hypothetical protein
MEQDAGANKIQRPEVVERLRARGIRITERTLRAWEAEGTMPKPAYQWLDGAVRSFYDPVEVDRAIERLATSGDRCLCCGQKLRGASQNP